MDARLEIRDAARPSAALSKGEIPLVTIAWRAMKSQSRAEATQRMREYGEAAALRKALAAAAVLAYKLRRGVAAGVSRVDEAPGGVERFCAGIAESLEDAVRAAGIETLAPEGVVYAGELLELFENSAQVTETDAPVPRIREIISPAVVYMGSVLAMGKAIVAVPAQAGGLGDAAGSVGGPPPAI